jgi:flagella basal body P-ring formation protein FlgA
MRHFAVVLFAAFATAAFAQDPWQPADSIRAAAISVVAPDAGSDPNVRATATLDGALRLARCEAELVAQVSSRGVALVECSYPSQWRVFVPVKTTRLAQVLVISRTVAAGQTVPADALAVETRNVAGIAGSTLADPAAAIGRTAARTLVAGSLVSPPDLVAPRAIHRGDAVTLIARAGALEVRASGRALSDAGVDERVSVENATTRRVLQGVVAASGEVVVAL